MPSLPALQRPAQSLKGVGSARAKALERLGIHTVGDLLRHYPRYHDDRSTLSPIASLQPGFQQTFRGQLLSVQERRLPRGKHLTQATIGDGTGMIAAAWWNQPYRKNALRVGQWVVMTGKVSQRRGSLQVDVPELEYVEASEHLHTGRLVPVYPLTTGLQQGAVRRAVFEALRHVDAVEDHLPGDLRQRHQFMELGEAYSSIHFPRDQAARAAARRRLAFDELYLLQLGLQLARRQYNRPRTGIAHQPNGLRVEQLMSLLPFQLTRAQARVAQECWTDMEASTPMNRLVQGDVGSGKTVVALLALAKAVDSGYQGSLMAPTEILAEQHFQTLNSLCERAGMRIALLTGQTQRGARKELETRLAAGDVDILVGTHAVIQESVRFHALSLVVTDEQHRFGVRQRATLVDKGFSPDVLVMTATPIPRTLALTIYGDLDVSLIDELPPGRRPVRTFWRREERRTLVYKFLREQVIQGRQAYVVCPLISESEHLEVEAASELAEKLRAGWLRGLNVGLLHGKLSNREKDEVMRAFRQGDLQVLVSTTVVEVGVDVPNATVIVIEGADRFGLAQLHQLRGRVARSDQQAYCVLIAEPSTPQGRQRLEAMERTSDGFLLAEEDLRLRGPGELLGTRQHGLPTFNLVDFSTDLELMQEARDAVSQLMAQDPELADAQHQKLRSRIVDEYGEVFGLWLTG